VNKARDQLDDRAVMPTWRRLPAPQSLAAFGIERNDLGLGAAKIDADAQRIRAEIASN
jgi:hypothetical protein